VRSVFLSGGMSVNLKKKQTNLVVFMGEGMWIKKHVKCIISLNGWNTKYINTILELGSLPVCYR